MKFGKHPKNVKILIDTNLVNMKKSARFMEDYKIPANIKFKVKFFPVHFEDATQGTIVAIEYDRDSLNKTDISRVEAIRNLIKDSFAMVVANNQGRVITESFVDSCALRKELALAAACVPEEYNSDTIRGNAIIGDLNKIVVTLYKAYEGI